MGGAVPLDAVLAVPVTKSNNSKTQNDFKHVSLTSLIMKQQERKLELVAKIESLLHPFYFACRENRCIQDTTAMLLNIFYRHLQGRKNHATPTLLFYVFILFFVFYIDLI